VTSSAHDTGNGWMESSDSFANGNCVLVKLLPGGLVAVRTSREAANGGSIVSFTAEEWDAFIDGCKKDEFDLEALRAGNPAVAEGSKAA
jgi:hypothetical protein